MDFKKIKKQFDKRNENLNDRGERETNEKIKPKTREMYDNLRYHISRMSNDDESYKQKMMKLNKNYVKKDELRQRMPSTTSMLRTNLNRDNAMEDTLAYPRSFQLVKKSVADEDNLIEPVKYRDVDEELNFDANIASLVSMLTEKARQLEDVLRYEGIRLDRNLPDLEERLIEKNFVAFNNMGSLLSGYNSLVREYAKPSLAKSSKVIFQSKFVELHPLLETINFGISSLIDLFQHPVKGLVRVRECLILLHSQSIIKSMINQIDSNSYRTLDQQIMNATFKNVVADLPVDQQIAIKRNQDIADVTDRPLVKRDLPFSRDVYERDVELKSNKDNRIAILNADIRDLSDELTDERDYLATLNRFYNPFAYRTTTANIARLEPQIADLQRQLVVLNNAKNIIY
jgi:hypothetical protein